jgi:hypothetical protein
MIVAVGLPGNEPTTDPELIQRIEQSLEEVKS